MNRVPAVLLFDVGKTNKKVLVLNQYYQVLSEDSFRLDEITDDDGYPCEDVVALTNWIRRSFHSFIEDKRFDIQAVNFSAYGASFVCVDSDGIPITPLSNYLKPYPIALEEEFYANYGGRSDFALRTASPVLGSLNSGMQLYRMKKEHPEIFKSIRYALHLPQYLSALLTGKYFSEITSVGCHTNLWDFGPRDYHPWVSREGITEKLAPFCKSDVTKPAKGSNRAISIGTGLHDSSAALIPYLATFKDPFVLISTGTWCISLNPFNHSGLTNDELSADCLCYLSYKGDPVKASRLFAGHEHERQVIRLGEHFNVSPEYYMGVSYDPHVEDELREIKATLSRGGKGYIDCAGAGTRDLARFASYEEAYHSLMVGLVARQYLSTRLIMGKSTIDKIFIDGGFSKNDVYMSLLKAAFPECSIFAASIAQASALGAAMAIHNSWNKLPLPEALITLL